MISKHKDLAIVFVRAISMLIIVIYHYSCSLVQDHITNNQANCIIINTNGESGMDVYVTYEVFAKKRNPDTFYDETYGGWYIMTI